MEQKAQLKYINKELKVGMVDWKEVYLLHPAVTPFTLSGLTLIRYKTSPK